MDNIAIGLGFCRNLADKLSLLLLSIINTAVAPINLG